jgi:uncharacterized protein YciI
MRSWIVISHAGPNRDLSKGAREQAFWNDHATFIDGLVDSGFIVLGGPLTAIGGGLLGVRAESESDVRATMDSDPWYTNGILALERIYEWEIFINKL